MSRRILQDQGRALNQTLANLDNFYQQVGKPVNVYKFRKVSGMIKMTNLGEQTLKYPNSKYQQTTNVYTGKEPVVVVWEGSTIAEGKDLRIIKHVQVGTYYQMYSTGANINTLETSTLSLLGKEYVNTIVDRDITLQTSTWLPTSDDMTEFVYLILDPINQSQQWLEISSFVPVFNEETKKFQYSEINFNNINLKYSTTGKTLLDFIQFGAIGEGYCFPIETTNEKGETIVSLDQEKLVLKGEGVNQIQFDFNSGAGNSDFLIFGRKKETLNEDGTIEMQAPHILWLYRCNFPKSSPFFYTTPNLNSYAMINTQPTKQGVWKSYKDAYKGNERIGEYNIANTKEVFTGFKHDVNIVRNTNPDVSTYINWDNKKSVFFKQPIWMEANPYFKSDSQFFLMSKNVSYVEFFNINAMINFYTDVINYEYTETTKYKLSETLGILGGIVNILVGGLNIGWTTSRTLAPTQPINMLVPCISFEDGKAALAPDAPLPTDIFIDDKAQTVLPTATQILTSWNFNLTDRCVDTSQVRVGAQLGKGGSGVWDLKYLGQTKFEDGSWINENQTPFKANILTSSPTFPSTTQQEWIIDYIVFRAVANCDMRISAYSNDGESIYSMFTQTNGKARKEPVIWCNRIKFNYYDEFNTLGNVIWPEIISNPKPDLSKLVIELPSFSNANIIDFQAQPFWEFSRESSTLDLYGGWVGVVNEDNWITDINPNFVGAIKGRLDASQDWSYWEGKTFGTTSATTNYSWNATPVNQWKQPLSYIGLSTSAIETSQLNIYDFQYINIALQDGDFFYIEISKIPPDGTWYTEEIEVDYLYKVIKGNLLSTTYKPKPIPGQGRPPGKPITYIWPEGGFSNANDLNVFSGFLSGEGLQKLKISFSFRINSQNILEIKVNNGTYYKNITLVDGANWNNSLTIKNRDLTKLGLIRPGEIELLPQVYSFLTINTVVLVPFENLPLKNNNEL